MKTKLLFLGFALIVFASQAIWVTFSPILTYASRDLGVSVTVLGFFAIAYPIFFLVFTVPSGILIDRDLRKWFLFGGVVTFAGGSLRVVMPDSFSWLLACQLLGALGQPFLLNAFVPYASRLYEKSRPLVVSVLSFSMYLGTVVALAIGLQLYEAGGIMMVSLPVAAVSLVGIILILAGSGAVTNSQQVARRNIRDEMKSIIRRRDLWILGMVLGLGVAVFDNISTWLQPVLQTVGLGQIAGLAVAATILSGLVGVVLIPNVIAARNKRTPYLRAIVLVVFLSFLTLSFLTSELSIFALLALSGLLMLPAYPIIMDWIGRFHEKEVQGAATGFMSLVSRVLTSAFTILAVFVIQGAQVYFTYLAVLILGAAVFVFLLPKDANLAS